MPPLSGEMHRDRALENVSFKYVNTGLIADALVPSLNVVRESDVYYIYTKDHFRLPQSRRANRAESNPGTWHASTGSYSLEEEALHDYVSDRDRRNAENAFDLDIDTTEILTEQLQIRKEWDLASMMTTTSWANSTSLTSTLYWSSNTTTSNPITLVDSIASVVMKAAGRPPNRLAITLNQYLAAKEHVSITDHIKYTSADSVTPAMLARLFTVDQVLVASGLYNQGGVGATDSMAAIWPECIFAAYMEPAPGLRKVSAMYRFQTATGGNPWQVSRWREEKRKSDVIEVSAMYQFKPVCTDCAYFVHTG